MNWRFKSSRAWLKNKVRARSCRSLLTHGQRAADAFTLIELMVSTSLLVLLVAVVTQITNSATNVTTASRKHLTADAQARMVFDRMADDFAGMLIRQDLDVICKGCLTTSGSVSMTGASGGGNDAIYFFSRAPAYYDSQNLTSAQKSDLALIGYRVNTNTSSPSYGQLERLGKGLTWDGQPSSTGTANGIAFLPNTTGTSDLSGSAGYLSAYTGSTGNASIGTYAENFADSTDGDFHLLGDGVYRLEYGYILNPYTDATGSFHAARFSTIPYDTLQGHGSISGWRDVAAIVVTLAILDKESQKMLRVNASTGAVNSTVMTKMQAALPDAGTTPALQSWQSEVHSSGFAGYSGNISKVAAAQVRVYQRFFYLNK